MEIRNFNSAFNEVTNYVNILPFLYRYENQNHIDKFFETGDIYISSFHNYKKYEDNELGDKNEGGSMDFGKTDDGKSIFAYSTVGKNDYSFCTSTVLDKALLTKFSRDSVFRIIDPINFMLQIKRSLLRVQQVIHGNCIYVNNRILTRNLPGVTIDSMSNEEGSVPFDKLYALTSLATGFDSYFLKEKKYQYQSEYRILWQTDRIVEEGIVINCPEARQYCEKIEKTELED
ncbi:MAG: hypothetical protein V4643_14580 [Bacteroidota bacterium]